MRIFKNLLFIFVVIAIVIISCKKDEEEPPDQKPQILDVNLGNDTTIVEGTSITLDAGYPGAEFIWSTGETTQTINVDTTGTFFVHVKTWYAIGLDSINISLQYKTIKVETDFGDFRIWLYPATLLHRQNFLSLTEQKFYDSLIFHRVVYDFVIQGGDPDGTGYGGPGYTIPAEIIPGLNHVYGAVGAARQPDNVNLDKESNGSQFYIVVDPDGESFLDGNYTVFGIVFQGMDAAFDISQVPVDTNDRPINNVYMKKVSVEKYTAEQLKNDFDFVIP